MATIIVSLNPLKSFNDNIISVMGFWEIVFHLNEEICHGQPVSTSDTATSVTIGCSSVF